jgi:hypothetical protein
VNAEVKFTVNGGALAQAMQDIQKKSQALSNDAIKSALEQDKAAKTVLATILQQTAAIERRSRIETQAARSVALEDRNIALGKNRDFFEGKKNDVFADTKLSEKEKKERVTAYSGMEGAYADKIKLDYRDNLQILREQERQSKLQTLLAKENLDALKQTAERNVSTIMKGDAKLSDVISNAQTDDEKLVARLTQEGINKEKKYQEKESGGKQSILGSLLAVDNLNKIISTTGQLTQTQNGFDLIQPASNLAGKVIGGLIGGVVGAFAGGVGAIAGAGVGASIGGGFGDVFGALEQREALAKENFKKSALKYRSITGSEIDYTSIPDMSATGVNFSQFMDMRSEYAKRRGYADNGKTAQDAAYLERGYGIESGTSASLIEVLRSSKDSNRDLSQLVRGIIEKGQGSIFKNGDTTFANEFVSKLAVVTKDLLKNNTTVSSALVFDLLKTTNAFGGMWDARDPRSTGLVSSLNSGLANPSSDNGKALAYRILSKQHPRKGIFSLREEMEKGANSPNYLKGVIDFIDQAGGTEEIKMENAASLFPGIPRQAIRTLMENRKNLKTWNTGELKAFSLSEEVLKGKAEANTTMLERNYAEVENGILNGEAVKTMADAFERAVRSTMSGAVIELNNGQGTIRLSETPAIQQNVHKGPKNYSSNTKSNHTNGVYR